MFKALSIELCIKNSLKLHYASLKCVKHTYIYMHFDCFWSFSILCSIQEKFCNVLHALNRGLVIEDYLMIILGKFSLILHKNICYEYSLEAPHNLCFKQK